jgi:6-phosphogluconolactonase
MRITIFILMMSVLASSCKKDMTKSDKYKFLVGTYTQKEGHVDGKGDGIYLVEFDMVNKSMKVLDTIKDVTNPSFLIATDTGKKVYAVNEISPNEKSWPGKISVFELDGNSGYRKAQEAGTYGNAPCHISLNAQKTTFAISNYLGSNLCYGFLDKEGRINGALKYITSKTR